MIFVRVFLRDQILGRRREIIEHVLLFIEHSSAVPVFSKFRAASEISYRKNSTVFEEQITVSNKSWRETDVEPAIPGK